MEVEQEREVEFEVEQIREKQRDVRYTPNKFPGLDGFIKSFIATGKLNARGPFLQAFEFVGTTKIGYKFKVKKTASRLFVSREFANTTVRSKLELDPEVLRPVEWVLWSPSTQTALIIIPEETEIVIPMLRNQHQPSVWLLSYAAPVTRSMQIFNSLVYFTIPSWDDKISLPEWLAIEIGILAGRLYFNYLEYEPLLSWLGPSSTALGDETSQFAMTRATLVSRGLSIKHPLNFLHEWLTYRRRTLDIMHTPMGFVCQRRILHKDHPFFALTTSNVHNIPKVPYHQNSAGSQESDDDDDSINMDEAAVYEEDQEHGESVDRNPDVGGSYEWT